MQLEFIKKLSAFYSIIGVKYIIINPNNLLMTLNMQGNDYDFSNEKSTELWATSEIIIHILWIKIN